MTGALYPTGFYCLEIGKNGRAVWPVRLDRRDMYVELAHPGPVEIALFGKRLPRESQIWQPVQGPGRSALSAGDKTEQSATGHGGVGA
jgi:hypothetical protein